MVTATQSSVLQAAVSRFFEQEKLVSAICHGVVLIARSKAANGKSVLHGRRTTTVPGVLENLVWRMTHKRMGRHYGRPYDETAEDEIRRCMARPKDLVITAPPVRKDAPGKEHRGFCLVDGSDQSPAPGILLAASGGNGSGPGDGRAAAVPGQHQLRVRGAGGRRRTERHASARR